MSDSRAHRGVFIDEALCWYALNVKEAASFDAHGSECKFETDITNFFGNL